MGKQKFHPTQKNTWTSLPIGHCSLASIQSEWPVTLTPMGVCECTHICAKQRGGIAAKVTNVFFGPRGLWGQSLTTQTRRTDTQTQILLTEKRTLDGRKRFVWLSCPTDALQLSVSLADAASQMFTARTDGLLKRETPDEWWKEEKKISQVAPSKTKTEKHFTKQWGCVDEINDERHTRQLSESFCPIEIYGRLIIWKSQKRKRNLARGIGLMAVGVFPGIRPVTSRCLCLCIVVTDLKKDFSGFAACLIGTFSSLAAFP